MLLWHGSLYLIDHGATLTFQHRWASAVAAAGRPYDVAEHALLGCGALIAEADAELAPRVSAAVLDATVLSVPDEWLAGEPGFDDVAQLRAAYVTQLTTRLDARPGWLPALEEAAAKAVSRPWQGRDARRTSRPAWLTGGDVS